MIKFMQLQRQVQLNTNAAAFAEIKEEESLFTEEELAENGDLISRYL
jgi:hypothetical protein